LRINYPFDEEELNNKHNFGLKNSALSFYLFFIFKLFVLLLARPFYIADNAFFFFKIGNSGLGRLCAAYEQNATLLLVNFIVFFQNMR
jgi:hypothetical protein